MACRELNRRDFLTSTALVSVTAVIAASGLAAGCSESHERPESSDTDFYKKQTLIRFARHLYPHNDVSDAVYSQVADQLVEGGDAISPFNQALSDGVIALDSARKSSWLSLVPPEQIAVMKEQEGQPYFAAVQAPFRANLYNRPEVWEAIGYGGPSAHLGGYVNRGFDDIDWLPEAN